MKTIQFLLRELLNVFVADGRLALGILLWVAGAAICIQWFEVNPKFEGFLLFLGIAGLLATAVWRQARKRLN